MKIANDLDRITIRFCETNTNLSLDDHSHTYCHPEIVEGWSSHFDRTFPEFTEGLSVALPVIPACLPSRNEVKTGPESGKRKIGGVVKNLFSMKFNQIIFYVNVSLREWNFYTTLFKHLKC